MADSSVRVEVARKCLEFVCREKVECTNKMVSHTESSKTGEVFHGMKTIQEEYEAWDVIFEKIYQYYVSWGDEDNALSKTRETKITSEA
eukprot:366405-Chlamydomonas_euryale.AAC.2